MSLPPVVIIGAARTPIGRYGGTLRDTHPAELGARAGVAALGRGGIAPGALEDGVSAVGRAVIAPDAVDEVLMGHGGQAGSGPNPARQVVPRAGLPDSVPG